MKKRKSDRVKVRGTVSRETAEKIRSGEIESNNGLRKSTGRRSWNPEQPDFELDDSPTFVQQLKNKLETKAIEYITREVFNKLIPWAGKSIHKKVVPYIVATGKSLREKPKCEQILENTEFKEVPIVTDSDHSTAPQSDKVIEFTQYRKIV